MNAFKPGYDLNGRPYAEAPPENIKINPDRKQRYEITIDFRDAPGGFTYFRGTELYYAWNCEYMTSSRYRGATASPDLYHHFPLERSGETTYIGIFYTDTPLDEAYYEGQEVCKWTPEIVYVSFKANPGDNADTIFSVDLSDQHMADLAAGLPEINIVSYYLKSYYPVYNKIVSGDKRAYYSGDTLEDIQERGFKAEEAFPIYTTVRRM